MCKVSKILPVCLIAVLINWSSAQDSLPEGSACKLHTGKWGVCKNVETCNWLIENVSNKQMALGDINLCGLSARNEDVVCCGDEAPSLLIGTSCKLHTGIWGACKHVESCNWLFENLETKKMGLNDIKQCSLTGRDGDIICCGDEKPKPTPPTDTPIDTGTPPSDSSKTKAIEACGKYSVFATTFVPNKIINGREAELTEFPHMVAFGYKYDQNADQNTYEFECGGSLIAERWVLTAAHCVREKRKPVIARMGKVTLKTNEDEATPVDRKISNIIRHPKYSLVRKKNDIALVQLNAVVEFNAIVRPACLYTDLADLSRTKDLIIAGWGSIEAERTKLADSLLKANVSIVPLKQCSDRLDEYNKFANNPSLRGLIQGQVCAKNPFDNSDSCGGDSGGPLMDHNRQTGISTVVGIVSFGVSCGSAFPGIYTRVAFYLDWIEKIVWP